ncbi:MAG: hypothetical protein R3324_11180, partial [Halobacteriales archaeon]|nr:hypothetical protein [Halobacteriales archaeon]
GSGAVAAVETGTDREALRTVHRRLMDHGFYFLPGHVGGVSFQTTEDQLDAFLEAVDAVTGELVAEGRL